MTRRTDREHPLIKWVCEAHELSKSALVAGTGFTQCSSDAEKHNRKKYMRVKARFLPSELVWNAREGYTEPFKI